MLRGGALPSQWLLTEAAGDLAPTPKTPARVLGHRARRPTGPIRWVSLALVFAATALAGCQYVPGRPKLDLAPASNPRPQQYLRVSGLLDPALNLKFSTLYGTTNRACAKSLGVGVGTSERGVLYEYTVTPRDGAYTIDVPMDGVEWGRCGWTMVMIHYSVEKVGSRMFSAQPLVWLGYEGPNERPPVDISCWFQSAPPVAPYPGARLIPGCYKAPLEPYLLSPGVRVLEVNVVDKG